MCGVHRWGHKPYQFFSRMPVAVLNSLSDDSTVAKH